MNYTNLEIIKNATFADLDGNTLSYKDLPQNKKVKVAGNVASEMVNFICTVKDNMLVTRTKSYTFIPAEAALLENAMDLYLTRFIVDEEDEVLYVLDDTKSAIDSAENLLLQGKRICAEGFLTEPHYRTNGNSTISTSFIQEIINVDDEIYLKTRNSVYRVISA